MLCLLKICLEVVISFSALFVPSEYGKVALLNDVQVFYAHNYLSGGLFLQLDLGDRVYYDGQVYRVTELVSYQAVEPDNPAGYLIDTSSGVRYSVREVKERVYGNGLVLLTCIDQDGGPTSTWGRIFVISKRVPFSTRRAGRTR